MWKIGGGRSVRAKRPLARPTAGRLSGVSRLATRRRAREHCRPFPAHCCGGECEREGGEASRRRGVASLANGERGGAVWEGVGGARVLVRAHAKVAHAHARTRVGAGATRASALGDARRRGYAPTTVDFFFPGRISIGFDLG